MKKNSIGSELEVIPRWAQVLAALVGLASVLVWWLVVSPLNTLEGSGFFPGVFFLVATLFMGSLFAGVILLTGYVNRDARRRGMSAALWTLLVLVIPNGIGFIVYFIARQPLRTPCPQCSQPVPAGVSFCGTCGFKVAPVCPHCGRNVSADQPFCPNCGQAIAALA